MMICDVLSKHVGAVKVFQCKNFRLIYDIQLVHLLVCDTHCLSMFALKQRFTRTRLLVAQANNYFTVATDIFSIITAFFSLSHKNVCQLT